MLLLAAAVDVGFETILGSFCNHSLTWKWLVMLMGDYKGMGHSPKC